MVKVTKLLILSLKRTHAGILQVFNHENVLTGKLGCN